jgi:hypothetical protein
VTVALTVCWHALAAADSVMSAEGHVTVGAC